MVRPPGRPPLPVSTTVAIRELAADEATLVPQRWGIGVRAAAAPAFACLTTEFTVTEQWATTLQGALASGAAGAAGGIELGHGAASTAAALYLVRFSSWLPQDPGPPRPTANIPGDTAAYESKAVLAHGDLLKQGFWEVEFHTRFAREGRKLLAFPGALATYLPASGMAATLSLRYRHGREHGETRVVTHRHNRWRLIVSAPAVPIILVVRILRPVVRDRGRFALAIRAFPALVLICCAWSAGEAAGAWQAKAPA